MKKNKVFLIPEYEDKLRKVEELKEKIRQIKPIVSKEYRALEEQLEKMTEDKKINLYKNLKEVVGKGYKFYEVGNSGRLCFFKGSWSIDNEPEMFYFIRNTGDITTGVATSLDVHLTIVTEEFFVDRLMSGIGFIK